MSLLLLLPSLMLGVLATAIVIVVAGGCRRQWEPGVGVVVHHCRRRHRQH